MERLWERDAILVLIVAFAIRLLSVAVTTLTSLNTYSQADAHRFADHARRISSSIAAGSMPALNLNDVYDLWGLILSPFWLIPGPSRVYARIGMAVLGAFAVYNVYVIARYYHSRQAGVFAIIPLLVFPSILFLHAAILRETMVLFGLTLTARLLLVPNRLIDGVTKYVTVAGLLGVVTLLREDNLPVYVLILATAAVLKLKPWRSYPTSTKAATGLGLLTVPVGAILYGQQLLERLLFYRRVRARGRTVYLESVLPSTVPEAIAFSWIGAMYFLFSPLPWMVSQVMDIVALGEGLINLFYASVPILGARALAWKTVAGVGGLVVGIDAGSILYGLGTVNVGTAVRHRHMLIWAVFLLGGIGIAQHVRFTAGYGQS